MGIQVTPIPRLTVLTVPAFTLGTANAAGSATTAIASDSTLLAFDSTLPDPITLGQSGAVGAATVVSRRDHAHQMEDLAAADQAEMEAASSTSVFASPGRTQYHPGVAKAWCNWEQAGAHGIEASYNVASVTDGGSAGRSDFLWATDFSTSDYAMAGMAEANMVVFNVAAGIAAGGATTVTKDISGAATDTESFLSAFGDQ
jgi:hypothetical protein